MNDGGYGLWDLTLSVVVMGVVTVVDCRTLLHGGVFCMTPPFPRTVLLHWSLRVSYTGRFRPRILVA